MAKIAIFGGTFNPFHIGHYEILSNLSALDFIDRVFIMPDKIPPHKSCDYLASNEDRIEMCRIVCKDFIKAELCLIEFEREGKSYSFDTVKALKSIYPDDDLYFVIGGDMLETLDKWYRWDELIQVVSFIVFPRKQQKNFILDVERMKNLGADIIPLDIQIKDISSTMFRKTRDKKLLPDKIYDYIMSKGLYND